MPSFDEMAALLSREQWIILGSILSTLAVRYAGACLRRKPRVKTRGDALVENLLQRLQESALAFDLSGGISTEDSRYYVNPSTGLIRVDEDQVSDWLTRAQRKRLYREARHIATYWRASQQQARLDAAVRRTLPGAMCVSTDWSLPLDEGDVDPKPCQEHSSPRIAPCSERESPKCSRSTTSPAPYVPGQPTAPKRFRDDSNDDCTA